MKIRLSFVTLTGAAMLALGAGAAQARVGGSQATSAQTHGVMKLAVRYQAETNLFRKLERDRARQQTTQHSLPSNMRGQDQLSTPGWSGELPF